MEHLKRRLWVGMSVYEGGYLISRITKDFDQIPMRFPRSDSGKRKHHSRRKVAGKNCHFCIGRLLKRGAATRSEFFQKTDWDHVSALDLKYASKTVLLWVFVVRLIFFEILTCSLSAN
jgi:hypothetical protein